MNPQSLDLYRAAEQRLWDHYGVSPTEHFVQLPGLGVKVRMLEFGAGDPVLFVHGSPNAGAKWTPLVARLDGFRCLVLDRPGCGLSDPVDYRSLDLREFGASLLAQTLDAFDLPRAHVVASSLGGGLAFHFTHAHPDRVARLVQEGCPMFIEGFSVPFPNLIDSVMSMFTNSSPPSREAFRHIGHAHGIDHGPFETEVLTWRDALLKYTDTKRNESGIYLNLTMRGSRYTVGADFLREVRPPTLYLWGEADPFGSVKIGERCASAQPDAILRTFPLAGHLPWLDDPASHARLIASFLRGEPLP